jgi:hypothetical protein
MKMGRKEEGTYRFGLGYIVSVGPFDKYLFELPSMGVNEIGSCAVLVISLKVCKHLTFGSVYKVSAPAKPGLR